MAAPTSVPLYALDPDTFRTKVDALMAKVIPDVSVRDFSHPERVDGIPLKPLPSFNSSESLLSRFSLDHRLSATSLDLWRGSEAEKRFISSLEFRPEDKRRRSSNSAGSARQSESITSEVAPPASNPTSNEEEKKIQGVHTVPEVPDQLFAAPANTPGPVLREENPVDSASSMAASFSLASEQSAATSAPLQFSVFDNLLSQLGDLSSAPQELQDDQQGSLSDSDIALKKVTDAVPDLSFMLVDHLVIPEKDPAGFSPVIETIPISSTVSSSLAGGHALASVSLSPQHGQLVASSDVDDSKDEWGDFTS